MSTDEKRLDNELIRYISMDIRSLLKKLDLQVIQSIEEIRLRANKPLMIQNYWQEWFIRRDGKLTQKLNEACYIVKPEDIKDTLELMCENSIYAFQDEIRNGYITLKGGHRVGITGKVVLEKNCVKTIKDLTGLNIRISKEIIGCARKILPYILRSNIEIYNTLIISPPQCGKTTVLRDIARVLSDGDEELYIKGFKVGIIDERSEIAACYKGIAQNRIGLRSDVLDGCPKAIGMTMMIRAMSPHVIITDEIGHDGDCDAVMCVHQAGVKIITTAHGYNISEMKSRREVIRLMDEKIFERYIVLSALNGPGTIEEIIDGISMCEIYDRSKDRRKTSVY